MSRRRPHGAVVSFRTDTAALGARWGEDIEPDLLDLALTHRSWAHENGAVPTNERLEFLGDSVLGIIVTDYLYHQYPDVPEGQLAKMRAATVSEPPLAEVARRVGIGQFIKLGKGELLSGGNEKDSILSDTMEALIGATYLSVGMDRTRALVLTMMEPLLSHAQARGANLDWKTSLQEVCAANHLDVPVYDVTGEGPAHLRRFTARCLVDGHERGCGTGSSKKVAEHDAAQEAFAWVMNTYGDGGVTIPGASEALALTTEDHPSVSS